MTQNITVDYFNSGEGFFKGRMTSEELNTIRTLVREQYLSRLAAQAPQAVHHFSAVSMSKYHEFSHCIEHKVMWPKGARILGPNALQVVTKLPFFQQLTEQLSIVGITTEEGCGWQEMYWRIVRPGNSDVGSLHADRWFWDLGHGTMPEGMRRLKIWIALDVECGLNGLSVIPSSHLKLDWAYHGEVDHTGIAKPKLDENINSLDVFNVPTNSGDFIIFHDDLIHGGMENLANTTRVSLEATLLIPSDSNVKNLGKNHHEN